ncbi:MAG: TIGR00725 family protein [Planctomycetes bacterium RBG_16_43_13]|nr:MAG: TIGR00725 family protein [Planctomycetes bacterium RBG_16_43_13]
MRKKCIAIIGGSNCTKEEARIAEEVGLLVAKKGAVVINGGLSGVMEHSSKGAKKGGGFVIGILPTADADDANKYVDVALPTGLGYARNVIVASADAVIAVGGSLGTLSEIAFALQRGAPVIGLGTWDIDKKRGGGKRVIKARNPKGAVEKVFRILDK